MTNNFINHLHKNLLKDSMFLEELYIGSNGIESWTLDISHLKFLTLIDCSGNKLATLPKSVRDRLDTTSQNKTVKVNLLHNKILCSCENLDFLDWLFTSKVNILKTEECTGIKGNITYGYQYLKEECGKDQREWLYPVQTICLLFILSVIALVVYKKRWALIYRWYLFRLRRKRYIPIGGCDEGYQFDAFLSFADEDRPFVDRVLEELEGNPELRLNVCVHFRDFIPGKFISRNIVSAIHSSKKTIVFMSRAYLKSDWCKYELRMAITEESHMNREVVIMTVLEDIPQKELSLEVLQYYKKNSYINKPNTEEELKLYWKILEKLL
nr:toll-like receptor 4 [Crassostrea gigas]